MLLGREGLADLSDATIRDEEGLGQVRDLADVDPVFMGLHEDCEDCIVEELDSLDRLIDILTIGLQVKAVKFDELLKTPDANRAIDRG
jgi:hypothetical protein